MEQLPTDPGHTGLDLCGRRMGREGHTAELPSATTDNHTRIDIPTSWIRLVSYMDLEHMVLFSPGAWNISRIRTLPDHLILSWKRDQHTSTTPQ